MLKLFTKPAIGLFAALLFQLNFALAQDWGNFGNLLSQIDSSKKEDYFSNLNTLQNVNLGVFNFGPVLDSLKNAAGGNNPAFPALNMLPNDSLVRDSLLSLLGISGFSTADSNSIINEYDRILEAWQKRQDSLANVFNQYQSQFDPGGLPTNYTGQFDDWRLNLDSLIKNQDQAFQVNEATGLNNFDGVFGEIFSDDLFTRIEFMAGTQNSKTNYYGLREQVTAPVIGLHSVEQFDRKWEPRWRVHMSWFDNKTGFTSESVTKQNDGINPFMLNGSFDIMFNPELVDNGDLRLITLLGIEAGTYAPAHKNAAIPFTLDNKGFTTGWGPVVGAGLTVKMGETTLYALGTTAFGDVICNPDAMASQYVYRSNRIEAGLKFGNFVTLRYETALSQNWANNGNKHIRYQQVTVGIPTTGLFR